ncbi:hypothetical protein DFH09DRAFT_1038848 [Mycena vulgaris]|nr:hypothetical protein DFH09DRAFT_1038848 [Mycena vulgaris]
MLSSSGTQPVIFYFLDTHRRRSPQTIPRRIMSDFDWSQIKPCRDVYRTFVLLCWWHVLHAWQQHFRIPNHPELWELLKRWIRMTDQAEFDAAWIKIRTLADEDFIKYLETYWMKPDVVKMWSAIYRMPRSIFEVSDTNMLIEAWHHVLKYKFLLGKRNRRLDHLIKTLVDDVLPYYALKQRRQDYGFEGPDIEVKKRQKIIERSQAYTVADIEHDIETGIYFVRSQSDPSVIYEVDMDTYTCTCLDYPLISFCKHICAVQTLFKEPGGPPDGNRVYCKAAPGKLVGDHPESPSSMTDDTAPAPASKQKILATIATKLELLAARLRRRKDDSNLPALPELEAALGAMILATDTSTVLPSARRLAPVVKDPTARQTMMPRVKTRNAAPGDPSYGGGANSGSKVKKTSAKSGTQLPPPASQPTL